MSNLIKNNMSSAIEGVLASHGLKEKFDLSTEFYVKIENEGFMPLIIEKHGKSVIIAHYFEQNGDFIPDPDMEFSITEWGWVPMATQNALGVYRRASEWKDGKLMVNKREFKNQQSFATMWARNIKAQGFGKPTCSKVVKIEAS